MTGIVLNERQKKAYDAVTHGAHGSVFALSGYAGSGKSATAVNIMGHPRFTNTLAVALSATAVEVIKNKWDQSGFTGNTVHFKTLASLMKTFTLHVVVDDTTHFNLNTEFNIRAFKKVMKTKYDLDMGLYMDVKTKDATGRPLQQPRVSLDVSSALADMRQVRKSAQLTKEEWFIPVDRTMLAERLAEYDLVVIDEYSMVSVDDHELIMDALRLISPTPRRNGALGEPPVVLVTGDNGQLRAIKAVSNDLLDQPEDGRTRFQLTEVVRSTDTISELGALIRQGHSIMSLAGDHPHVHKARGSAHSIFRSHKDTILDADVVLATTNKTVDWLNKRIRSELGRAETIQAGDKIRVNKNTGWSDDGTLCYPNGLLLTVKRCVDPSEVVDTLVHERQLTGESHNDLVEVLDAYSGELTLVEAEEKDPWGQARYFFVDPHLATNDSLERQSNINFLSDHFDVLGAPYVEAQYAYAMTIHKAQGSEWDHVVYMTSPFEIDFFKDKETGVNWHAPYTAVTRARSQVNVFISTLSGFIDPNL